MEQNTIPPSLFFKQTIGGFKAMVETPLQPGLTILVGPNGSGKSTLLSALNNSGYRPNCAEIRNGPPSVVYHDFHLGDLKTKSFMDDEYTVNQIASYSRSSGEGVLEHIVAMLVKVDKPTVFIFDEFDRGIHLTTQKMLVNALSTQLKKTGSTCIASAHGAGVIMSVDNVLDMSTGAYCSGKEYVIKSLLPV